MPGPDARSRYAFTAPSSDTPTIVNAEGMELITESGRRILDAAGGAVVNNIGWGRTEVADAVAAAMQQVAYVLPTWTTPNRLELVDLLVEQWLPDGFEHVSFACGGSEANDSAIRLARMYHLVRGDAQRHKVIGRLPSYHGATLATLGMGGHMARREDFEILLPDWPQVPWNNADALADAIEAAGPDTVSAFIAEPIIGAAGAGLIAPQEYWSRVSEICNDYGILMIADEVMTGFGRTGKRWGHEHDGWQPDIIVSAKGLGGGYVPISMLTASNRVVDPITEAGKPLMFFTYTAHDSSCAGALAVLRIIEREKLAERATTMGQRFIERLQSELGNHQNVFDIRGRGLMVGVELTGLSAVRVVGEAMHRDAWIYPAASSPGVGEGLLFSPPLTVSDSEINRIVEITKQSIDAAAGA